MKKHLMKTRKEKSFKTHTQHRSITFHQQTRTKQTVPSTDSDQTASWEKSHQMCAIQKPSSAERTESTYPVSEVDTTTPFCPAERDYNLKHLTHAHSVTLACAVAHYPPYDGRVPVTQPIRTLPHNHSVRKTSGTTWDLR